MNLQALFLLISSTYGLPQDLLSALCYVESNHNPKAINKHDGGSPSRGICQVKLETARLMGYKGTAKGLMRPEVNIDYAARYLAHQLRRYKGDYARAISAYNQGTSYSHGGSAYSAKVFNRYVELTLQEGRQYDEDRPNRSAAQQDQGRGDQPAGRAGTSEEKSFPYPKGHLVRID